MSRARPALISLALFSTACVSGTDDSPPAAQTEPEGVYGDAPAAVSGTPSVVSLQAPLAEVEPAGQPLLDQFGLAFSPRRMVVRVGEPVTFTNSESLAHNIHVRSVATDSTILNVDTDPGDTFEFAFDTTGGYDVLCDIHPGMRAFIYATASPYTVIASDDGSFFIGDVPPGTYTVSVWSVDPALTSEVTVEVGSGSTRIEIGPAG